MRIAQALLCLAKAVARSIALRRGLKTAPRVVINRLSDERGQASGIRTLIKSLVDGLSLAMRGLRSPDSRYAQNEEKKPRIVAVMSETLLQCEAFTGERATHARLDSPVGVWRLAGRREKV